MKNLQKYILPLLVFTVIGSIYLFYFSPMKGLGSFSSFDPDSHAQKEIKVRVVHEMGTMQSQDGSRIYFTAEDKSGVRMKVEAPHPLPDYFHEQSEVHITGHVHGDVFTASEIAF